MLTTDITCSDEFGRFLNITEDYSTEAIKALYEFYENMADGNPDDLRITRDDIVFIWNEYNSVDELNVEEFESVEDIENAGYTVLMLDNGKFVTDYDA